jgi:hypothetical protein
MVVLTQTAPAAAMRCGAARAANLTGRRHQWAPPAAAARTRPAGGSARRWRPPGRPATPAAPPPASAARRELQHCRFEPTCLAVCVWVHLGPHARQPSYCSDHALLKRDPARACPVAALPCLTAVNNAKRVGGSGTTTNWKPHLLASSPCSCSATSGHCCRRDNAVAWYAAAVSGGTSPPPSRGASCDAAAAPARVASASSFH